MSTKIANLFSDLFISAPTLAEGEVVWICDSLHGIQFEVTISEGPYDTYRMRVELCGLQIPVLETFLSAGGVEEYVDSLCIVKLRK